MGKFTPVGTKLVTHHHARHDTHPKGNGKDLDSELEEIFINGILTT
jgi:hypothetical protein